ncbi:N-acetylneuraminate epimerase [Lacunisphaera limnophila]|uniref:N-acetylneuraminate epimerase n=1 Tax=Lacunisphaera limnophila TaxID=1838286 RepID=A0A1D8AY09_9BACT|nr:kelch repeat-containing protein [Lacunisphaera limnophila]AOS45773.1 N-acetylneuraminate epimerase [Lacunisphaera limnophila]
MNATLRRCRHLIGLAGLLASAAAWATSPTPPTLVKVGELQLIDARQGAACVALGDFIYVFGGSAGGAITHAERIDTRTNQVERLPGKFVPRRYHNALTHAGKIYLFGGQGYGLPGDPYERAVEIYDPATGAITQGPAMSRPRSSMAAGVHGGQAYLIGGSKKKGNTRAQTGEVDVFDFATSRWSQGVPMPLPRESMAVVVGDLILVPGGYRSPQGQPEVLMFVPPERTWKTLPPLDRSISAHSTVFLGEHLFLFGDFHDLDSVLAYNLRTRESALLHPGFTGARHTTATVCNNRIYVIGGNRNTETGDELPLVQVFALSAG